MSANSAVGQATTKPIDSTTNSLLVDISHKLELLNSTTFQIKIIIDSIQQSTLERENKQREDEVLKKLLNQYAVPDIPAIQMLGVQSGNILRPSTPKALAVSIAQAATAVGFGVIPAALALEFSPSIFINNGLPSQNPKNSIQNQDNDCFKKIRVSLATTSESQSRSMAIGLRYTHIDEVNKSASENCKKMFDLFVLQADKKLEKKDLLVTILAKQNRLTEADYLKYKNPSYISKQKNEISPKEYERLEALNTALVQEYNEYFNQMKSNTVFLSDKISNEIDSLYALLESDTLWTKNILDFGIAARGKAADSLFTTFQYQQVQLWGTFALRLDTRCQLVLGINAWHGVLATNKETDSASFNASGAARFYYGANSLKVYFDGSVGGNTKQGWFGTLSLGAEARLNENIWLELGASWKSQEAKTVLPVATIRYGLN